MNGPIKNYDASEMPVCAAVEDQGAVDLVEKLKTLLPLQGVLALLTSLALQKMLAAPTLLPLRAKRALPTLMAS